MPPIIEQVPSRAGMLRSEVIAATTGQLQEARRQLQSVRQQLRAAVADYEARLRAAVAERKAAETETERLRQQQARYPLAVEAQHKQAKSLPMVPVTILTGVKDTPGKYLRECWESIKAQTYPWWELVVVQDGEATNTEAVLREMAECPRVRIVRGPGRGLGAALNTGLALCRTELVARMDGDDVMRPERLERQVAAFMEAPDTDVLGSQMAVFTGGNPSNVVGHTSHQELISLPYLQQSRWGLNHPTTMLRLSSLRRMGGYREIGHAEDLDLWLRMAAAGMTLRNLKDELVWYRQHGSQASKDSKMGQIVAELVANSRIAGRRQTACFLTHSLAWGGAEQWLADLIIGTQPWLDWKFIGIEGSIGPVATERFTKIAPIVKMSDGTPEFVGKARDCEVVLVWWVHHDVGRYRRAGNRVVAVSHTSVDDPYGGHYAEQCRKYVSGRIDLAVGVSRTASEIFEKGGPGCPVRTIHNGFRGWTALVPRVTYRSMHGIGASVYVAGYLGRMDDNKRWRVLRQAGEMAGTQGQLEVVFAGRTYNEEEMKRIVAEERGPVKYLGWTRDIGSFLGAVDCLVICSEHEGFPNVLAEAWLARVPALCTPVGAAQEWPELVYPLPAAVTPEAILSGIKAVQSGRWQRADGRWQTRKEMVEAAYQHARKHLSHERFCREWVEALTGAKAEEGQTTGESCDTFVGQQAGEGGQSFEI